MTEAQIQNQILCFLAECGLDPWINKTIGVYDEKRKSFRSLQGRFSAKGSPDILCIMPDGKFLGIEVKSKIGRPSEHQLKFISRIHKYNGIAFISRSVEQTYDQLEKFWPEIQEFRHLLRKYTQLSSS